MIIIAVNGGSASGKTTLADHLEEWFNSNYGLGFCRVLSEDRYYHPQDHLTIEEREKLNFDHPESFEHQLLADHLTQLKAGNSIHIPEYCYKTHTRLKSQNALDEIPVLIVEGIHVLTNPLLLPSFDLKVFVKTPLDVCLARRIQRDVKERARTVDSVIEQYMGTVRPMYEAFIKANKDKADLVIDGHQSMEKMLADVLQSQFFIELSAHWNS
ncbi:uridine kinase [Pleionea sediminis]|uniref:uridine kinase n=1 Tax=Pleionea sediminis TaxID=2569479 RepID=UPI0011865140|nr:uridine kinase [Pleionea sediminis]